MSRIYTPISGPDDWKRLLAEPEKHWKPDHSAMLMAETWLATEGFPPTIVSVLSTAPEPIRSLVPLIILPEHQVALPGGSAASQSDAWVLASHPFGLASITVEGKVGETFGPTMSEWLVDASLGKERRITFIKQVLGLTADIPGTIRYQLLHRMASAILEAKTFHANVALCMVQSFSATDQGLSDYQAFGALFGQSAEPNEVVALGRHEGVVFYSIWVRDTERK